MTFRELEIAEPILKAICEKGYEKPTPIQERVYLWLLVVAICWELPRPEPVRQRHSLYRSCNIYWPIVRRKIVQKHEGIKDVS